MGMFDYVRCEYALPDYPLNVAQETIEFQTKDTDEQYLSQYVITAEGYLMLDGELQDFTGCLDMNDCNIVASGPGTYTKDGEDSYWLEYKSLFVHGKLTHIERMHYSFEPAQKSSLMWREHPVFANPEERSKWWDEEKNKFAAWQKEQLEKRRIQVIEAANGEN